MLFKELNRKCGFNCDFRNCSSISFFSLSRLRWILSLANQSTANLSRELITMKNPEIKMVRMAYVVISINSFLLVRWLVKLSIISLFKLAITVFIKPITRINAVIDNIYHQYIFL